MHEFKNGNLPAVIRPIEAFLRDLKFTGLVVSRDAGGDRICAIERQIL